MAQEKVNFNNKLGILTENEVKVTKARVYAKNIIKK
jgi:hypothetical protein